jgi:hypothetical protein
VDEPLSTRISGADRTGLVELVSMHLARLTERDASQALRHPYASEAMIVEILSSRTLMASRGVRRLVAAHPRTPRSDALRALDDLLWRDLMDVGRDSRTPPPVRQAANRKVLEALRGMASGERIALARFAHPALFPSLFQETDPRILEALLQNPRLTADDVLRWLATGRPRPDGLAQLAADGGWATRPPIRGALLLHPETPRAAALALLTAAGRDELRRLCETPGTDPLLAACAAKLLAIPREMR